MEAIYETASFLTQASRHPICVVNEMASNATNLYTCAAAAVGVVATGAAILFGGPLAFPVGELTAGAVAGYAFFVIAAYEESGVSPQGDSGLKVAIAKDLEIANAIVARTRTIELHSHCPSGIGAEVLVRSRIDFYVQDILEVLGILRAIYSRLRILQSPNPFAEDGIGVEFLQGAQEALVQRVDADYEFLVTLEDLYPVSLESARGAGDVACGSG